MPADALRYRVAIDESNEQTQPVQVVQLVGHNKRVLEVGPATGYMTEILRRNGCSVTGVEIDPAAAEEAAPFCERMIVADVEDLDFETVFADEEFDVAVYGEVLEHLIDPHRLLKVTAKILRPGGYVVASVPNVAHASVRLALLSGAFPYTKTGLLDHTHLRFFTQESLAHLFKQAGYVVRIWRRIPMDPFATELSLRRKDYPPYLVEALERDEDAMTYQYVVKAYPSREPQSEWAPAVRQRIKPGASPVRDLVGLEQALADKLVELAQVHQDLNDARIVLADRDASLAERDASLAEREARLDEQGALLAEREREISRMQARLSETEEQLRRARLDFQSVTDTLGYRSMERVRSVMRWLFPPDSWRRRPYRALRGLAGRADERGKPPRRDSDDGS